MDMTPIFITVKLACIVTMLLIVIGIPCAYGLALSRSRVIAVLEALVSLPIVLPPSVLGFYLLLLLNPHGLVGRICASVCDVRLVFSFSGLVIGSAIYSFPFMVNALKTGFRAIPMQLIETSYSLGKSRMSTLLHVILPNARNAMISGIALTFAHTMGAFGILLMIGGNIPNKTRVASIAIYSEVEALRYSSAHQYALVLLGVSFVLLWIMNMCNQKVIVR